MKLFRFSLFHTYYQLFSNIKINRLIEFVVRFHIRCFVIRTRFVFFVIFYIFYNYYFNMFM